MDKFVKKCLNKIRFWEDHLELALKSQDIAEQEVAHKEKNEGKEDLPPAPPIGEREEEKKTLSSARACENGTNIPPTLEQVKAYCANHPKVDPVTFWNFYESKGWKVGNVRMKNWHNSVATWERPRSSGGASPALFYGPRKADNWRGTRPEDLDHVLG